jgi:isoleucyl-tRNA synthetase
LGDWDNPYLTLSPEYEAKIIEVFGELVKKNYIYKAFKPVLWCPNCVTALAEAEVEYEDYVSPSIFVEFKIKNENKSMLIWTTTPWTLPANVAIAVNADAKYVLLQYDNKIIVLAKDLVSQVTGKLKISDYKILEEKLGKDLEGIKCLHPFIDREVPVVLANYVTMDTGTGCVHTAPGHGKEDYETGLKYNLPILVPVNDKGKFTDEIELFKGMNVFEADPKIIEFLKEKGPLLYNEEFSHPYPHCWRCKKPVIFRATPQWFMSVDTDNLRKKMLEIISKVKWVPQVGENRIRGMIESRPDWCLSRQRFWGIPIPVLYCKKCNEILLDCEVIDKFKEMVLKENSDVWFNKDAKEITGNKKCAKCGNNEFEKENNILDVWFDSSVSHRAVLENKENLKWPADLYLEGSDQHRGWFQVSLITGVATKNESPFSQVLTHGFTVDEEGKKMSKSIGNFITADEAVKKYGADIIRLWVSSENYQNDVRFGDEILKRIIDTYRRIRNTLRFIVGNLYDFDVSKDKIEHKDLLDIDKFILHRLQETIKSSTENFDNFEFFKFYQDIHNFCAKDLSAFYFDILKDRLYTFHKNSLERKAAQTVLHKILVDVLKLLAPVLSFTTEEVWSMFPNMDVKSVHLSDWPNVDEKLLNEKIADNWSKITGIRDMVLKSLEDARNNKLIGKSLEAKVEIKVSKKEIYELLKNYSNDLPAVFIVSQVALIKTDDGDIAIEVKKADGSKCERCWNYSETVAESKEHSNTLSLEYLRHPTICSRCLEVLNRI